MTVQTAETKRNFLLVSNLNKTYANNNKVLKDISFSINEGDKVSIIGSNGSGKSTLLRSVLRLVEPDNGSINIFGSELMNAKNRELRQVRSQIGFIFQKHNLVAKLSVLSNVLHGSLSCKSGPRFWYESIAPKKHREEAMECLKIVGLEDFAKRKSSEISGGQSQRVAIARALMQKPKIIFADEPVSSLDPKNGEIVMELFHKLSEEQKITLVFVSHNVEHALKYSQRVIGLKNGEKILDRETKDFNPTDLRHLYE